MYAAFRSLRTCVIVNKFRYRYVEFMYRRMNGKDLEKVIKELKEAREAKHKFEEHSEKEKEIVVNQSLDRLDLLLDRP